MCLNCFTKCLNHCARGPYNTNGNVIMITPNPQFIVMTQLEALMQFHIRKYIYIGSSK